MSHQHRPLATFRFAPLTPYDATTRAPRPARPKRSRPGGRRPSSRVDAQDRRLDADRREADPDRR